MFFLLQCCITAHEKILNTYSGQMQFDYELQDEQAQQFSEK